jgi:hypothetical protein
MTTTDFKVIEELDAAATLQALMDQAVETATAPSGKARSAQIAAAITDKDVSELLALQEKMVGIVGQIVANTIDPDHLGQRDDGQLESLMVELLDQKDVERLLKVRYAMIRAAIFAHINEANKAKGLVDPELAPGEAEVPTMGKKFTREGGRIKATLDHDKLRKALGVRRWKKICNEVTVPAVAEHTELVPDEDKILELVRKDPKVLELFRDCVSATTRTPQSFHVRKLD